MSFKPYTEKIKKKQIGICSDRVGSGSRSRTGSIIPEADPRIRIRIKMIRIRNTDNSYTIAVKHKRNVTVQNNYKEMLIQYCIIDMWINAMNIFIFILSNRLQGGSIM